MKVPILQFRGVGYAYNNEDVFSGITLTVDAGDFVAVVGPNGGGKSTILKLAVGLLKPRCGSVRLCGADGLPLHGKQIGYVAQNPGRGGNAFPATVYEVVSMGRTPLKGLCLPFTKADRHIVQHVLELVDMWEYKDRLIGELSGGQAQRVYVARALALNPDLLIMDEPTTGIDTQARERLYTLLGTLNKNLGVTVIVVSHDIERILRHAKTVICVNRGIPYCGPVAEHTKITEALYGNWRVGAGQVMANV